MAAWQRLAPGARVLILAAGVLVLGAGWLGWQTLRPAAPGGPEAAEAPQVSEPLAAERAGEPAAEPPAEAAPPPAPAIDAWRVGADGAALVAGLAVPGAGITVRQDGAVVAEGSATPSGEFVLQFALPPTPGPSLLTLTMTPPGGEAVDFPARIALGPIAGPEVAVAAADPPPAAPPPTESPLAGEPDPADPPPAPRAEAPPMPAPPEPPAALLITEGGAVVLQDEAPAAGLAGQVMIDTIAYGPDGAVQVGGHGAAGGVVRLYLDNAEAAVTPVPDSGRWLAVLAETAPGLYTLRADLLDPEGKVVSRFETPFQRETPEALAAVAGLGAAPVPAPAPADAAPQPDDPAPAVPQPAAAPEAAAPPPDPVPAVTITVQPGFTLWGIAQDRMGDGVLYVQLFEANRDLIRDPDLIYPGQVFAMPEAAPPP